MSSRLLHLITPRGTPQLLGSYALYRRLIAVGTICLWLGHEIFTAAPMSSRTGPFRVITRRFVLSFKSRLIEDNQFPSWHSANCRRMLSSTFEMTDIHGPDRLSRMIVSFHPVLFWMFFVIGSPAMLPKNSHTNPSPYVPCTRQTLMLIPVKSA